VAVELGGRLGDARHGAVCGTPPEPRNPLKVVGATGFEPATSRSQSERSTRLSHAPTAIALRLYVSFADAGRAVRDRRDSCGAVTPAPAAGYWKYGFTPCGSGVLSSATIIDEI
jgi:hypothetical protein